MSTVHSIIEAGDVAEFARLLQSSSSIVQEIDDLGNTPLHTATYCEHLEIVNRLLTAGAAVNARGPNGYTALHIAVEQDNEEIAALLLDSGADPCIRNSLGWSVVHHAARSNPDIIELLLDHGVKLDAPAALRMGRIDEASSLLDKTDLTPQALFEAALGSPKESDALLLLFDRGYSPNPDAGGRAPIVSAVEMALSERNDDSLRLLLGNGADPNVTTSDGTTPLTIASRYGKSSQAPGSPEDGKWGERIAQILRLHGAKQ